MNGCIYRTKDGECDLYSEGGKYHAWCEMDGCDGRKMSNADRIRAMTDEELTEWLAHKGCFHCDARTTCIDRFLVGTCQDAIMDWLKQEAGS